jgi:hypothetical protein
MLTLLVTAALQASQPVEPQARRSSAAYVFANSLVFDPTLSMVSYGPFRSGVTPCGSRAVQCVDSDILALVAPKKCAALITGRRIAQGRGYLRVVGTITYAGDAADRLPLTWLLHSSLHENVMIGYQRRAGIVFVIVLPATSPQQLLPLLTAKGRKMRDVQFEALRPLVMPATGSQPILSCTA